MADDAPRYFHGSPTAYAPGERLAPRGAAYEAEWGAAGFYPALGRWRPPGMLPHRDAVFLVGCEDDVELAGGSTAWCLEVRPDGPITRHDLNWSAEVSALVEGGAGPGDPRVEAAARAYWAGTPHPSERLWEYLAAGGEVVACAPYDAPAPAP